MALRELSDEFLHQSKLVSILNSSSLFRSLVDNDDLLKYLYKTKNIKKNNETYSKAESMNAFYFNEELVFGIHKFLELKKGILKNQLASTLLFGFPKIKEHFLPYQIKEWLLGNNYSNNFLLTLERYNISKKKTIQLIPEKYKLPKDFGSVQQMTYFLSENDAVKFVKSISTFTGRKKHVNYKRAVSDLLEKGGVDSYINRFSREEDKSNSQFFKEKSKNASGSIFFTIDVDDKKTSLDDGGESFQDVGDSRKESIDDKLGVKKSNSGLLSYEQDNSFSSEDVYNYDYRPSELVVELSDKYDLPNEGRSCLFGQIKTIFSSEGIVDDKINSFFGSPKVMELISELKKGDYIFERVKKFAELYKSNENFKNDVDSLLA